MIELIDISKIYRQETSPVPAIKDISLIIKEGDFVAIQGPSGSGKSTLLNILGCLDRPSSGEYHLNGKNISKLDDTQLANIRNNQIGFVFQKFNLLPRMNVIKNVELPLVYANVSAAKRKDVASGILESVGLNNRILHFPNELSGGEQQRVAIARALVNDPKIILADEPTGNLDTKSGQNIMDIFKTLNNKGITVVIVTHEPAIAKFASKYIVIRDGLIVESKL